MRRKEPEKKTQNYFQTSGIDDSLFLWNYYLQNRTFHKLNFKFNLI